MAVPPPPAPPPFQTTGAARAAAVLIAVLFSAVALCFGWLAPRGGSVLPALLSVAVAFALFLLVVRPAFVARLELRTESLRYTPGLGAPSEIAYRDLRGFRRVHRRGGPGLSLLPDAPGGRALDLPSTLGPSRGLRAALAARLTDLDAADVAADLEQVKADSGLGTDERSRLDTLARSNGRLRVVFWIMAAAVVASFVPPLMPYGCWALAAIPVAGLYLVATSRGALTIGAARKGARPDAGFLFLVPAVLLIVFDLRQWHVDGISHLGVPWAAAGLLVLGAAVVAVRSVREPNPATYVYLAIFTFGYSCGVVLLVNCGLDHSDPQLSSSTVVGRRIGHGRSTNYYVSISPWKGLPETREVQVSGRFYNQHPGRTPVTVVTRPGLLAIPWFVLQ